MMREEQLEAALIALAACIEDDSKTSDRPDSFVVRPYWIPLATVRQVGRALGWPVVEQKPGRYRTHMGWMEVPDPEGKAALAEREG